MAKFTMDHARVEKENVANVAREFGYAVGIGGNEQDGYKVAIRTNGQPGTEAEFQEALKCAGLHIDTSNIDFKVTDRAKTLPR